MLTAHHLTKSYGIHTVLHDISFSISNRERLGLIGPNGCGKSTLMRILIGIESPDSGSVIRTRPGLRIGYLAQGMEFEPDQTLQSALKLESAKPDELEAEIASVASALASRPDDSALQAKYDSLIRQISSSDHQSKDVLSHLGLAQVPYETAVANLSGGQKTRLMLARILLEEPQLLLLDEPTNHLDIEMLEWLENWLNSFSGAALIVSHDRVFLDHTVSAILDLNEDTHSIRSFPGNYSYYLLQYLKEQDKQRAAYRDQEYEIRRMKQDIARTKEQARHVEITTTSRQPGVRRLAKKVAIKAKSREKKLSRYLDSDERVEKPKPSWQMKLEFTQQELSRNVLMTENLAVGYEADKPLLSEISIHVRAGQRIALTGANGAGKTTFVRTIAGKLMPLSGQVRLGTSVTVGYMAQEQELLDPNLCPLETVQRVASFNETEARNFLHYFLFSGDDALRPCRDLSYGERARLQLGLLVAEGCNFLLLDEPINHLDIPSRARFEQALNQFKGTVLAVVHDRYFIEHFASELWLAEGGRIEPL
ncbi:MAG TPA: ABC-F family ATP-binding cassette domain-containing protein [Anaerolineales bacterium]|nr:ABC-F family ATP-binding cassette domain-containing protein [Anaerolineales bacterium]